MRKAAIACVGAWAGIWVVFMLIRFSGLDVRAIPGAGPILLLLFAASGILPLAASVLALVATIQDPKVRSNWIALAAAVAILCIQAFLFTANKWM